MIRIWARLRPCRLTRQPAVAPARQGGVSCGADGLWRCRHAGRGRLVLAQAACLLLSLCVTGVWAQQPASVSPAQGNEALLQRIQLLEARLEGVEAGLRAVHAPCVTPRSGAEEPRAPEGVASPTAPEKAESQQARDRNILDFFRKTEVSGLIDTYYAYNFNRPRSRRNGLRSFDSRHNQFGLPWAELILEKRPDLDGSRLGFRLDLAFGPAADFLSSAEPGGVEVYKHIHQAYGSYLAPVGAGLQFDVGKFVSWAGAEWDESKDNWNYSRGLLYTFAQPGYHAGVRANYNLNDKVEILGAVVNGWDNVEDNNGGKSYGVALNLTPTTKLSLSPSFLIGPEQPDTRRGTRKLFDLIASYEFSRRVALMGNYDYASDKLPDGSKVRWQGAAVYLRYAPTERLAFSPRFEWYADYEGYTTGTAQRLKEFTVTGEYKLQENLLTRLEYRRDWSDKPVFERGGAGQLARHQTTVLAGLAWSFGTGASNSKAQTDADAPAAEPTAVRALPPVNDVGKAQNPILSSPFFVRQHYVDFLAREPDEGGYKEWVGILDRCPDVNNDPSCDRAAVSAAFSCSPEFQLKGSFVFRFYKVAFGRLPEYAEIIPDMRSITGGSPEEVYAHRVSFVNEFAERREFSARYGTLSNSDYVTSLLKPYSLTSIKTPEPTEPNGTVKVTLTSVDLVNSLDAGALTRAQVLRAIADSDQVTQAEYNPAFVAMQYYGYLRRTPEDGGYEAWLSYLNAHPSEYGTIVKGFMNSIEYKLRFAP